MPAVTDPVPLSKTCHFYPIASTRFAYPWRDGQAELAWVAWFNIKTVTNPSDNLDLCRVTLLMWPTMLELS